MLQTPVLITAAPCTVVLVSIPASHAHCSCVNVTFNVIISHSLNADRTADHAT